MIAPAPWLRDGGKQQDKVISLKQDFEDRVRDLTPQPLPYLSLTSLSFSLSHKKIKLTRNLLRAFHVAPGRDKRRARDRPQRGRDDITTFYKTGECFEVLTGLNLLRSIWWYFHCKPVCVSSHIFRQGAIRHTSSSRKQPLPPPTLSMKQDRRGQAGYLQSLVRKEGKSWY